MGMVAGELLKPAPGKGFKHSRKPVETGPDVTRPGPGTGPAPGTGTGTGTDQVPDFNFTRKKKRLEKQMRDDS